MSGGEGSTFGKYFLLKRIATGGMGEIYLAKLKGPVGFEKLLVIKRILAQHCENEEFVDMFFAEARVAAQLNHSNIVQIYEMGEIDDAYFIAMEYVHGKSLRDLIDAARERGERLRPAYAIDIISRVCAGMSYAHNARDLSGAPLGIIHRDLNPHNVLVSYSGEVKVIDFGIAKSEMSMHKTETGTIKGKFVYMSPEQSAAEKLDKRSDLFSIGICLYETLTYLNPFAKANIVLSLDAIQRKDPPSLTDYNPKLAPLVPIVTKALAKDREQRYADCDNMREELQQLLRSGIIPPPPKPLPDYMQELFHDQIESEKRMILATDQANTTQIEAMRRFRHKEHRSGSYSKSRSARSANKWPNDDWAEELDEEAAHVSAAALEPLSRSRIPFFLLLSAIMIGTVAGAITIVKVVESRDGLSDGSSLLSTITPVPATNVAMDTPAPPPPPPAPPPSPDPAPSAESAKEVTAAPAAKEPEHKASSRERERTAKKAKGERDERPAVQASSLSADNVSSRAAAVPTPPTPPPPPLTDASRTSSPAHTTTGYSKPAPTGLGTVQISSVPPVQIKLSGSVVGQTIRLKSPGGVFTFGSGSDPKRDPFRITIRYRLTGDTIVYVVDADPWAIVRGKGGIGYGKTPLAPVPASDATTVFDFANPKEGRVMRISFRFSPP